MPSRLYKDLKLWYKPNRNSTGVTHSQIPSGNTGNGVFTGGDNSDNLAELSGETCPSLRLDSSRDTWVIDNLNTNQIITDKEFTFYIDFDVINSSNNQVFRLKNSNSNAIITIGILSDSEPTKYRILSSAGSGTWIPSSPNAFYGYVKMIIKYDGAKLILFINGQEVGENAESFTDVIDKISLDTAAERVVEINEIAIWNFPKTDAECLELTRT